MNLQGKWWLIINITQKRVVWRCGEFEIAAEEMRAKELQGLLSSKAAKVIVNYCPFSAGKSFKDYRK